MPNDKEVLLSLTKDESLVLFELLSRFAEEEKLEIIDQSEERVLWNVLALLEKILSEPFEESYKNLIDEARFRLKDS